MNKTKFRPILFSTPMVQAILENRKTKTRRTKGLEFINEMPDNFRYDGINNEDDSYKGCYFFEYINTKYPPETYAFVDPVMNVGDVLWVRETFFDCEKFKQSPLFSQEGNFIYKATNDFIGEHKWKPSLFMPKEACRIFLKVKSIKVERLQDISEEDAKMEGAKSYLKVDDMKKLKGLGNWIIPRPFSMYQFGFLSIWCTINGCESWLQNPFVFVYEFERIEKPLDFI